MDSDATAAHTDVTTAEIGQDDGPDPAHNPAPEQEDATQRPTPPQWIDNALADVPSQYPDDRVEIGFRGNAIPPVWRIRFLDCPGKVGIDELSHQVLRTWMIFRGAFEEQGSSYEGADSCTQQ